MTQPKLPRPGQRTYLGCAYLYIEAAFAETSVGARQDVAKDLRAYINLLTAPTLVQAPSITAASGDASKPRVRDEVMSRPRR